MTSKRSSTGFGMKVKPDEEAVEYADRTEAVLERHYEETGERISPTSMLPEEGPGETSQRIKKLNEAMKLQQADRERAQGNPSTTSTGEAAKDTSTTAEKSSRSFRLKSQERDVQQAVSAFEGAQKKLYRTDGTKLYSEEEHAERLAKLREEFAQKIEKVVAEAEQDAKGYEKEALAFSYTDPASQVSASERSRLETSRAFVKEDCEDMTVPTLSERLSAVSAGSDKAAKVLHTRYGRRRLEALNSESNRLARAGQSAGPEAAREIRTLTEAVTTLEEQIKDSKTEERRQGVEEAAKASYGFARDARIRKSEVDGTAERARQHQAERARAAF